jgi:tRNA (guanine-N7-)-methyltransferase
MRPLTLACGDQRLGLEEVGSPMELDRLLPGNGPWEVEIGFGKGRYLLASAAERPDHRFLGIEVASKYFRLAESRAVRQGLSNVVLAQGEALFMMCAVLPAAFADVVHVYFPDPWPKDRHHKRRLFDRETVDLLLRMLSPGGLLSFATDFLEYGEEVTELLTSHPGLEVAALSAWPEGPRTNYEMKYETEGREIIRLEARLSGAEDGLLHPAGVQAVTSAVAGATR